ncbi:MAG: exodeoxyribonuclease VII large subunit [Campylobacterota bacterium]|nr:exodeoxyribonuclease VII large subunit [Campylobacterota bacterium]
MTTPLSVSALNEQVKTLLESTFMRVYVEAELSRITYHNSGHIYFTLKDSGSTIRAVMFKGNAAKLRFRLEEGLKVLVDGALTLYKPRGEYQINCFMIEPSGQGALALAYEQLKQKLHTQGYFDSTCKKPMPEYPEHIALITSATGAALQDMQRVASNRWPLVKITVFDVLVQGKSAAGNIAHALGYADAKHYDIIVIGRGGGSIEDLWAFNEEVVANAIFEAKTPVVSAVGHEIDWVISDYVSDLRAPTPSAAMEMILPDINEARQTLDATASHMSQAIKQKLSVQQEKISTLKRSFTNLSIENKIKQKKQEIKELQMRFSQNIEIVFQKKERDIRHLEELFRVNNPKLKSKEGFAQLSRDGKVTALSNLHVDDTVHLMDDTYDITASVISVTEL